MKNNIVIFCLLFYNVLFGQKPVLMVQEGHSNLIQAADISDDGKWFITSGIDQTIKLWDAVSGKAINQFGSKDAIYALKFYKDSKYFMSGSYGNYGPSWIYYDVQSGVSSPQNQQLAVAAFQWSKSKDLFAIGHTKGLVAFYNLAKDTSWFIQTSQEDPIRAIDFSLDESKIVVATSPFITGGTIQVYDTKTNSFNFEYKNDSLGFKNVYFLNDHQLLVEGSTMISSAAYLLDLDKNEFVRVADNCARIELANDKSKFYGIKENNVIEVSIADYQQNKIFTIPSKYRASFVMELSKDDSFLILAGRDILKFDLISNEIVFHIPADLNQMGALAFSPNGNKLAFNDVNGGVLSLDLETGKFDKWKVNEKQVVTLAYDMEGSYLASASLDSTVTVWEADGSVKYWWKFDGNNFNSLSIDKSGKKLAVCIGDTVYFTDILEGVLTAKTNYDVMGEKRIFYSPNNKDVAILIHNTLFLWNYELEKLQYAEIEESSLEDVAFSYDGRYVAVGGFTDSVYIFNTETMSQLVALPLSGDYLKSVKFALNSYDLVIGRISGRLDLLNVFEKKSVSRQTHHNSVTNISFSPKANIIATASKDGNIIISSTDDLSEIARLYAFDDGTWAITDLEGRYDAPNAGEIDQLHFVVGTEVLALSQFKERYYDPGLLQKILGYNKEPLRDVSVLDDVKLFPEFKVAVKDHKLEVIAKLRDVRLGVVSFIINGIEREHDISSLFKITEDSTVFHCTINLDDFKEYFVLTENNLVGVKGYNADNYLVSNNTVVKYQPVKSNKEYKSLFTSLKEAEPKLFAIVVGTSDYSGNELDLKYADSDAEKFANALTQTSQLMFGDENVDIRLLTTNSVLKPSKRDILNQFKEIENLATSEDLLVVYFSGHGMLHAENGEDHFHYLTMQMRNADLSDPEIRNNYTISTNDLTTWIASIPVQKQVLIIDACSSGGVLNDMELLASGKDVTGSHKRAIERVKDRVGTFILVGSASDQRSYESPKFQQSLLTYSLLSAIKTRSLREDEFVDVFELFEYALEEVPLYAAKLNTTQQPSMAQPKGGGSFDIGKVDSSVVIELAELRPVFSQTRVHDDNEDDDVLGLSDEFDNQLNEISLDINGEIDFTKQRFDGAYYLRGSYVTTNGQVKLTLLIKHQGETISKIESVGDQSNLPALVDKILKEVIAFIESL